MTYRLTLPAFTSPTFLPRPASPLSHKRFRACATTSFEITSAKNSRIKDARALLRRRARDRDMRILLEGHRLISDAFSAGAKPIDFFYTRTALQRDPSATKNLCTMAKNTGAQTFIVDDDVLNGLCDTMTPQGVVAVCARPHVELPVTAPPLTLVLDGVADPGNVGALLRSAAAAGATAALLAPGCADVWALKTLRAGMGAQFRMATRTMDWQEVRTFCEEKHIIVRVADGMVEKSYSEADWCVPSAVVVGSEAEGPCEHAWALADEGVCIPMAGGVESLNVAMAGAVIMFEAKRQRELSTRIVNETC